MVTWETNGVCSINPYYIAQETESNTWLIYASFVSEVVKITQRTIAELATRVSSASFEYHHNIKFNFGKI